MKNYSTSIYPFESRKCGKEGEKLQKFEYLENKKSFRDEIKNIFHSFWRAIIWWKNKLIKSSRHKLYATHLIVFKMYFALTSVTWVSICRKYNLNKSLQILLCQAFCRQEFLIFILSRLGFLGFDSSYDREHE